MRGQNTIMKTPSLAAPSNRSLLGAILTAASLTHLALAPANVVAQSTPELFTRITSGALATTTGDSEAVAWIDIDNDGWMDLFLGTGGAGASFLYKNNRDGSFAKMTSGTAGTVVQTPGEDCAWADYDNDGFLDVFVTVDSAPSVLQHNDGTGRFSKISAGTLLAGGTRHRAAAWGDFDGDGFIDLFTTTQNRIYRNNGDGTFSRMTNAVIAASASSTSCTWIDYNNDGRPDIFASAGLDSQNYLYRNDGNGVFTRQTAKDVGGVVSIPGNAGVWADYDNDGLPDVWISGAFGVPGQHLYRNNGAGGFTEQTTPSGLTAKPQSTTGAWGDYDNDGYIDLFVPSNPANLLYHNEHDGTFKLITSGSVITDAALFHENYSCAWGDYDNDGFLDLAVSSVLANTAAPNFLYKNVGNTNAWLRVKLVGTRSNRSAIGAKVRVLATIGGKSFWQLREISGGGGYGSQNLLAHFGLGDATSVETLRIEWPSGQVQELPNVSARQQLTVIEPTRLSLVQPGEINISSWKGIPQMLEASEDLQHWVQINAGTESTGASSPFSDPELSQYHRRFYRTKAN
jgi:hypothetical protein